MIEECKKQIMGLELIHLKLQELTDGEEDQELQEYNNYLLESLEKSIHTIKQISDVFNNLKADCESCINQNTTLCYDCGLNHILSQWKPDPEIIKHYGGNYNDTFNNKETEE